MSEIMKLLMKPPKLFYDTVDIRKTVPPIELDQSKNNPEEDMIEFSLSPFTDTYRYMNIARELLKDIEECN